jgi:hypothetical protein
LANQFAWLSRPIAKGLAFVRHIVEMHGGRVEVSSAGESKGSTFRVRLPADDIRALKRRTALTGLGDLSGIKRFAIDNEEDALGLLRVVVEPGPR